MYLEHYQLESKPFEIDPDPKFLWLGEKHKEAFATLKYVIKENKGLVCLMGEPGTGKSIFLNGIAYSFGSQILSAKIHDPSFIEGDFFNFVADAFKIEKSFNSREDFFIYLRQFALDASANAKRAVLVIDDAHRLGAEAFRTNTARFECKERESVSDHYRFRRAERIRRGFKSE